MVRSGSFRRVCQQGFGEPLPILIIADDGFASIPAIHDRVNGAFVVNPQCSWLSANPDPVKLIVTTHQTASSPPGKLRTAMTEKFPPRESPELFLPGQLRGQFFGTLTFKSGYQGQVVVTSTIP